MKRSEILMDGNQGFKCGDHDYDNWQEFMKMIVAVAVMAAWFCVPSVGQTPTRAGRGPGRGLTEAPGPVTSQIGSTSTPEFVARTVLEGVLTKCQWKDEKGRAADSYFYFDGDTVREFRNGVVGKFVQEPVKTAESLNGLSAKGYITMTAEVARKRFLNGPWTSFSDDMFGRVFQIDVAKRDGRWYFGRSRPASEHDFDKQININPSMDYDYREFIVWHSFDPDAAALHRVSCEVATAGAGRADRLGADMQPKTQAGQAAHPVASRQTGRVTPSEAAVALQTAKVRLAALEKQLEATRRQVEADGQKALDKVRPTDNPSKGEFETTAEYQARLQSLREQRKALDTKLNSERGAIIRDYKARLEESTAGMAAEINTLKSGRFPEDRRAKWVGYDADLARLSVDAGGGLLLDFSVQPADARAISGRRENIVVHVDWTIEGADLLGAKLIDRATAKAFELARQEDGSVTNQQDGLRYVWVPPGKFMMGCSPGDVECRENERPAHEVTITRGFWMGQTEVTQEAYQRVVGAEPSEFKGPHLPVEMVFWNDAERYCETVGMRLPTEAEWEYAARGGTVTARYGSVKDIAVDGSVSMAKTKRWEPNVVGQMRANGFGLYDMLGNVDEWVSDWYDAHYYTESHSSDPKGPPVGPTHVVRGGNFLSLKDVEIRASWRDSAFGYRSHSIGFRCASN